MLKLNYEDLSNLEVTAMFKKIGYVLEEDVRYANNGVCFTYTLKNKQLANNFTCIPRMVFVYYNTTNIIKILNTSYFIKVFLLELSPYIERLAEELNVPINNVYILK